MYTVRRVYLPTQLPRSLGKELPLGEGNKETNTANAATNGGLNQIEGTQMSRKKKKSDI